MMYTDHKSRGSKGAYPGENIKEEKKELNMAITLLKSIQKNYIKNPIIIKNTNNIIDIKENNYVIEYCSNPNLFVTTYEMEMK